MPAFNQVLNTQRQYLGNPCAGQARMHQGVGIGHRQVARRLNRLHLTAAVKLPSKGPAPLRIDVLDAVVAFQLGRSPWSPVLGQVCRGGHREHPGFQEEPRSHGGRRLRSETNRHIDAISDQVARIRVLNHQELKLRVKRLQSRQRRREHMTRKQRVQVLIAAES